MSSFEESLFKGELKEKLFGWEMIELSFCFSIFGEVKDKSFAIRV